MNRTQIFFHTVETPQAKVALLVNLVKRQFELNRRVLVSVPNDEAARFMDQLLWRTPEESFIPHQIVNKPCSDLIAITTQLQNLNQAQVLINLCPLSSPLCSQFECVFELLDQTHPEKMAASLKRKEDYLKSGYAIIDSSS